MRIDVVQPERGERPIGAARRERIAARLVDARVVVEFGRGLRVGDDPALAGQRRKPPRVCGGRRRPTSRDRPRVSFARLRPRGGLRLPAAASGSAAPAAGSRTRSPAATSAAPPSQVRKRSRTRRAGLSGPCPPRRIARASCSPRPGDHEGVDRLRDVLDLRAGRCRGTAPTPCWPPPRAPSARRRCRPARRRFRAGRRC